jgi:hypothetical protein
MKVQGDKKPRDRCDRGVFQVRKGAVTACA